MSNLLPYTVVALAETNEEGTDGGNIVAGAVVQLFNSSGAVTMYDDSAGLNPETTKVTGSNGQVVIWIYAGQYELQVNGDSSKFNLFDESTFITFTDLEASQLDTEYLSIKCIERGNAEYIIQPSGYVALEGDATLASGLVAQLQDGNPTTAQMMGKILGDDTTDAGPIISAGLERFSHIHLPPDDYNLITPIVPQSESLLTGVRGASKLYQQGQYAVAALDNLYKFVMRGLFFSFENATDSRYYEAINLKSHRDCIFDELDFEKYDDQTIMTRMPSKLATSNTIDNLYSNWSVSACAHLDIGIGLEGYYYLFTGDGANTTINTSVVWPEQLDGSVAVIVEDVDRRFTQKIVNTDYTVSYDGSNNLTVEFTVAPAVGEMVHIWPAQPRVDGNRRPLSNNTFRNIKCQYVFITGRTAVRWVDAENEYECRFLLADDNTTIFQSNPYINRTGEGGDFCQFYGSVHAYRVESVSDPETITGLDLGPGSGRMGCYGVMVDGPWKPSDTNRYVDYIDSLEVILTGTVDTVAESPIVTGTGTLFETELTLVGSVKDLVVIDGVKYAISSIDSNTQLTLSSSPANTLTGEVMNRRNISNGTSYMLELAGSGNGQTSANSKLQSRYILNSVSEEGGDVQILTGDTSVVVRHTLARAPLPSEIVITAASDINGKSVSVSSIGASAFIINIDSVAGADYTLGWSAKLRELN